MWVLIYFGIGIALGAIIFGFSMTTERATEEEEYKYFEAMVHIVVFTFCFWPVTILILLSAALGSFIKS